MSDKPLWHRFNPALKDKLEENPNLTILGLWWASQWRLVVLLAGIAVAIAILAELFD